MMQMLSSLLWLILEKMILSWWRPCWHWIVSRFRKHKRGILVIGSGGVGKTSLAQFLHGEFGRSTNIPDDYIESLGVETKTLLDDKAVSIIVPPGQLNRRGADWKSLLSKVAIGEFQGVIVVCANGYHSIGDFDILTHEKYDNHTNEFRLAEYLASCRSLEVDVVKRIAQTICTSQRPIWLLSIVGKQDLWWDQITRAEEFYKDGAFGKEIKKIAKDKGDTRYHHELVFTSLKIGNFKTGRNVLLQENCRGYGQQQQIESQRKLSQAIAALKNWTKAREKE